MEKERWRSTEKKKDAEDGEVKRKRKMEPHKMRVIAVESP